MSDSMVSVPKEFLNDVSGSSDQVRYASYMIYPDSMDIQNIIHQLNKYVDDKHSFLISPLHDKDLFDDGTPKKPHYHLFYMLSQKTNTTVSSMRKFGKDLGLVGCEIINSKRGYARYLCHLDELNKPHYNVDDVISLGCDYLDIIGDPADRYEKLSEMLDFINESDIIFYSDFVDYCRLNRKEWFRSLTGATFLIEKYIRERRNKYIAMQGFASVTTTRSV